MIEDIITQVTERILDFDTQQIKKVQTALYIVLNKYDIQEISRSSSRKLINQIVICFME